MPQKGISKYAPLLKDDDVARWLRNLGRGSPITADVAKRRLSKACELLNLTPKQMVELAKRNLKGFQDDLEDMVFRLEKDNKAPQYIQGILKNVKSWLRYNDITLTRKIKISNLSATPTIENEQIPSQEELSRIFRNSSSRVRLAEALIAFADLRPESIGNYDGSDGLKLGDLPEVVVKDGQVLFENIPTMIMVRAPLSKARHKYFTFLSAEGCTYLKEYLEERIRNGEKLTQESPLIVHERTEISIKPFMITSKITHLIRTAMRKSGVNKRPYVLRAYAETQLIIAESKGKISHTYLQFIAGHKGDIESKYSTNKGRLPPEFIDDIRNSYKQCEPFLSTFAQPIEQATIVKEAKLEALKAIAKNMLGIDLLEVKIAKERELKRDLSLDEIDELFEDEIKKKREEPDPQKIVKEEELEACLVGGWQFVSVLPSNKILIRK
ncbi:hypothetical protein ANME2D_02506 [Candidatus Methanoperedens nitroreducens]|uniref:Site-specific integrase n=1 Tax=Candidatus Methanoperedens nitratireducens TaxID=1392998 RepID=A0A062V688_9EURY|nr:hypothetical protein [Candidatus Methanoperedens nitroreducens]KCZ71304.1 hypothetical protein ANME2D_02506 [Candidatus Methanoperedens nitroreducens]MDJ1423759.1 hypothetical protein [Candidatus Methanoperedens sp.]